MSGGWQHLHSEVVRAVVYRPPQLMTLCPEPGWSDHAELLFDLMVNQIGEYMLRDAPNIWSYPGYSALALNGRADGHALILARDEFFEHWQIILKAEEMSKTDVDTAMLLADII